MKKNVIFRAIKYLFLIFALSFFSNYSDGQRFLRGGLRGVKAARTGLKLARASSKIRKGKKLAKLKIFRKQKLSQGKPSIKDRFLSTYRKYRGKKSGVNGVKRQIRYSDDLVKSAQKLYPKKAGKIELHHPIPQYLGGSQKQKLVPIDGAYHQQITNEFRRIHPYSSPKPSSQKLREIMDEVYSKYPLPE